MRRQLGRVSSLDGLRGIAIVIVVASHISPTFLPAGSASDSFRDAVRGGWLGVDIFFVLSGFLITALLLGETPSIRFRAFYWRRAVRLLPALWTMLVAYEVYAHLARQHAAHVDEAVRAASFYVSNWVIVWHPASSVTALSQLWSLAVEEQFYIVWPLVLAALSAVRRPRAVAFGLTVAIAAVAIRRGMLFDRVGWFPTFIRTDARADALLVGALAAWCWSHDWIPRRGVRTSASIAALVAVTLAYVERDPSGAFWYRGGMTLYAIVAGIVILAAVTLDGVPRFLSASPLVTLGRVSYGLYLWHFPIFVTVEHQRWSWFVRLPVALSLTAAATALSWRFIEQPASRLRGRLATHR